MPPKIARRHFLAGGIALAGALRFPEARSAAPNGLKLGLSGYPPNFLAWSQSGTSAGTIKLLIHRGLLSYGPDGSLRGELADQWEVDGAGVWSFRLREAAFHDGRPVTSGDVKWNIERVAAQDSAAYLRGHFRQIVRLETPDERTIRISTSKPVATLPGWFAHYNMPILPKGAAADSVVGAGPFRMVEREYGVALELAANDHYYKPGLPHLESVRAVVYADENLRVAALEAGDVDLIEFVPWQSMKRIRENPDLSIDAVNGPFMYLTFNGARPPFDDPRVRKAIAHAVNRDDIVAATFYGHGKRLTHLPLADSSAFFNPELAEGWRYDPALARQLLADAGLSGGLSCNLLATSQYGMHQSTAEIVQAHLLAAGVNAKLQLVDWPARVRLGNTGHYDMAVMGTTADSNDPDGLTDVLDGTLPPSFTRSYGIAIEEVDSALAQGRHEFDPRRRREIYGRMERAAIESVPIAALAWRSQAYAMRRNVAGFSNLPGQLTTYSGITLEETELV